LLGRARRAYPLIQWFSTGGPLVGHGALLVGRQAFLILLKIKIFGHKFHKKYKKSSLSATKASRNNKMS